MSSTFNGLEVAKRALHAQQSALYTTSHNISNANTDGYTRQRVNFEQTAPYPPASRNRPEIPGQVGSGVQAGSIERIRDTFVDKQYRQENTKVGYYDSKADMMSKMESIMNEPSEEGLSHTMDQFWQSLQDLSVNPEDSGARSVVKERGVALADTFNYLHNSLQDVRANMKNEISVDNTEVNSIIDRINKVNRQISEVEPHGQVPNDLYDERDRLVDDLSQYVDINVDYQESTGQPSPIAQGIATITLKTGDSEVQNTDDPITLVDGTNQKQLGTNDAVNHMFADFGDDNNVKSILFAGPNTVPNQETADYVDGLAKDSTALIYGDDYKVNGKFKSLVEGAGYLEGFEYNGSAGTASGEFNQMLTNLDKMTNNLVTEFNNVHQNGYTLTDTDDDGNADQGGNFFEGTTADTIAVTDTIKDNVDQIAASTDGSPGNGENAIALADVYTKLGEEYNTNPADEFDEKTSMKSYFEGVIGEMGVAAEDANRMQGNSQTLRQQVEENRQSISSVSLDEEMTNMVQFQHAYNAAARNMTVVDEMLDRVINNMGLVGR
ncbi:flagellar hook-associated protein FlgK [Gracilibacillus halophilus YIM-C55.5]|uniref:Flagellar hook-associated protein 1 n=1 Tax=Gracilibacillus halophilus YIM-C55.5 TaxID=1308866 RepID=N4WQI7_9BACI|nr:flagellar hook-associated protein FlgK [Gracilibacillus halophilus]ENH98392.1 flagellar hook-associated protein FlgK [Gracilibacillus halophilus YIM-C55.5]